MENEEEAKKGISVGNDIDLNKGLNVRGGLKQLVREGNQNRPKWKWKIVGMKKKCKMPR
jgi:hypothetical protein